MNNVQGVGTTTAVSMPEANRTVNFRAQTTPAQNDSVDTFIKEQKKEQEKAKKSAKKQQYFSNFVLGSIALASLATLGFAAHQAGWFGKKVQQLAVKDVSKAKSFDRMSMPEELKKEFEEFKVLIEREKVLREKGVDGMNGMLMYGKPGGGKNTFVYALTKYIQEKFPGSVLFEKNALEFNDKYFGESENNIIKYLKNVAKYAKKNPDKKVILFLDEIDSVMRKDLSVNSTHSEKLQNAFKIGFNEIAEQSNIILLAATNKASKESALDTLLDDAILNRIAKKVHVPLGNSQQDLDAFIDNFKELDKKYISPELIDKNNPIMKKVCDFISQDERAVSFRDIREIAKSAKIKSEMGNPEGTPITMEHFKQAVLDKANQLNWPQKDIEFLRRSMAA